MTDLPRNQGIRLITRLERLSAGRCGVPHFTIADILFGIFQRYFTGSSMIWTEEVARLRFYGWLC